MSVLTDSNDINFEVCHRVLSQSVYASLCLIQVMLNMSTLSTNDQGKSFWQLVYGSTCMLYVIGLGIESWYFCADDEHSNGLSERGRHVCVCLHALDQYYQGGRHWFVTWKRLWSVCLPHVGWRTTSISFDNRINVRHSHHCTGSLHCCLVSNLVQKQCKNCFSNFDYSYAPITSRHLKRSSL